jgi:hypothetical protein
MPEPGVKTLLQQLVLVSLGAMPGRHLFIGVKLQVFEFAAAQSPVERSPLRIERRKQAIKRYVNQLAQPGGCPAL